MLSTVANKTTRQLSCEKYYTFKTSHVQTKKILRSCIRMISSKQSNWSCRWPLLTLCEPPLNRSTWRKCTAACSIKSSNRLWLLFAKICSRKFLEIMQRSISLNGKTWAKDLRSNGFGRFKRSETKFSDRQKLINSTLIRMNQSDIWIDSRTSKRISKKKQSKKRKKKESHKKQSLPIWRCTEKSCKILK